MRRTRKSHPKTGFIEDKALPSQNPTNNGRCLSAEGLCLTRQDGDRPPFTLKDISLRLEAGELLILQGPSGCGKSSLLQALARMIPVEAGSLTLDGLPASACPAPAWRMRVSLARSEAGLEDSSIGDNLLLPWSFRAARETPPPGNASLLSGLAGLGLAELPLDAGVGGLSSGQAARVALLRHLLLRPGYLLLDEPTANLDAESAGLVWRALERHRRETGCGILAATHRGDGAAPDRVLRFRQGHLREG